MGITHYNNIKDEGPKEKKSKQDKGLFKRHAKRSEAAQVDESAMEEGAGQIIR